MKKILIFTGLAILAYQIYRRIEAFKNLNISLQSVSFENNILAPVIILKLALQNNSDVKANLQSITGNVYINNSTLVATVLNSKPTVIEANTVTYVDVPVTSFLPAVLNTISVFLNRQLNSVTFNGQAMVDGILFPIDITKNI